MQTTENDSTEVIVLPPAVVDLSTVEVLARKLEQACALGPERVIVDFSGVSFSDVTVVDALLQAADRLERSGCALQVRQPDRFLTRVADVLGLRARLGLTAAA